MLLQEAIRAAGDPIDIRALKEDPASHIGAIDETSTSLAGGWFSGWALQRATATPARGIIVSSAEGAILLAPNHDRPDLLRGFGPAAIPCGLRADIPLRIIPPLFAADLTYYAFDGDCIVTRLPVTKTDDRLARVRLATEADFYRLVQTPSTRIADTATVTHLALHALARSDGRHVLAAAATCVLGYRLLEGEVAALQRRALILDALHRLLRERAAIPRGLFMRWHTSLALVAGYLAFQSGDDAAALGHFSDVIGYFIDLRQWPQALTNILIGIAITGYLLHESGATATAIETWGRAEEVLRYGASLAEFQNVYAYGELGNAVQVAQFCHTAALCAEAGGVVNDVSLAPVGTVIDIRRVVGPIGRLVAERGAAERGAAERGAAERRGAERLAAGRQALPPERMGAGADPGP